MTWRSEDGFYVGDRVECWVEEDSIRELRLGWIESINIGLAYPITVRLDEALQWSDEPLYNVSVHELTRVAE